MIPSAKEEAGFAGTFFKNLTHYFDVPSHAMQKSYLQSPTPPNRKRLVHTVGLALVRPALSNSGSKVLERAHGGVPVNACIGDRDALLEAAGALRGYLLVALIDVGLNHDTNDAGLAVANLVCDVLGNLRLVTMVLVGVAWDSQYNLSVKYETGWSIP
jgi:hypothetical protein